MGFRTGAYAKVWSSERVSDTITKLRISISKKNKKTMEYEQEFSGFVSCIGTAAAKSALSLTEGSRIKLGDVDVKNRYVKEKNYTYTDFYIYSFDNVGDASVEPAPEHEPEIDGGKQTAKELPF